MDSLSTLHPLSWPADFSNDPAYLAGNAAGWLSRGEKNASTNYPLSGRLYVAKSGWLLLSVPNALVRGVFDAVTAPGVELPLAGTMNVPNVDGDVLNAHISIMTADEVASIGANKINERGHQFGYLLGPVKEINVKNVEGVSKVWAIQVSSPALSALRKSYGLSPMPKDQPFHITVAVRRKGVLLDNGTSKCNETSAETTEEHRFSNPISRGSLKAAAHECNCSGCCTCPPDCDCKKHCGTKHAAAAPWATFVVAPHEKGYAATTRPTGDGKFGLPGGKLEPGEDPLAAAQREAQEEGWDVSDLHPEPLYKADVDGKPVWWYRARAAQMLNDFKEKGRVVPTTAQQDQLTEFGNDIALKKYLSSIAKQATEDKLTGGEADGMPDSKFSPEALAEGAKHEHEHTRNDQVAKEIAKDHLQEDPSYYEKQKELEKESKPKIIKELLEAKEHSDNKRYDHKAAILRRLMEQSPQDWEIDDNKPKYKGVTHKPTKFRFHTPPQTIPQNIKAAKSVYMDQLKNLPFARQPFVYDHNKPVFENIQNHMRQLKQRGDWILKARRNEQLYRSTIDPHYRHQLAMQAFHGQMPQPLYMDRLIEQYGDNFLGAAK